MVIMFIVVSQYNRPMCCWKLLKTSNFRDPKTVASKLRMHLCHVQVGSTVIEIGTWA